MSTIQTNLIVLEYYLYLNNVWHKDRNPHAEDFDGKSNNIQVLLKTIEQKILNTQKLNKLLGIEVSLTKCLCKTVTNYVAYDPFSRDCEVICKANAFLNHCNYLAYGLTSTTLRVLDIHHCFVVMHGKNCRGALVFVVTDLIKEVIILPWSFILAKDNAKVQEFTSHKVLNQHNFEDLLPCWLLLSVSALESQTKI